MASNSTNTETEPEVTPHGANEEGNPTSSDRVATDTGTETAAETTWQEDGTAQAADTDAVQPGGASTTGAVGGSRGSTVPGAAAVVSAGLGLASLTGTSLGEMMRTSEELTGQIEASTGGGGDQIEALYGAPWSVASMFNGIIALIAIALGIAALAAAKRSTGTGWVGAVALGGLVLGVIGLLVAGTMYLDLFGSQPTLPQTPGTPGMGG